MSNDKVATSSSDDEGTKAELPDRDVYLRIKPALAEARIPYVLNYANSSFHEITILEKSFRFKGIFDQDSSQTEVFDTAIRRRVIDFIKGKSSTILSYGGSHTGKQHTLYGTIEDPGIIYQTMSLLFSKVCCTAEPWYLVDDGNQVTALDELEREQEVVLKRDAIGCYKFDGYLIRQFLRNRCSQECSAEMGLSSVWISVVSAVNGQFYDVFSGEIEPDKLHIRDHNPYVPSCAYVYVTTAAEACELLLGVTARRERSSFPPSRPYIFTIKLLKYQKENDADSVSVSTLTFCNVTDGKEFSFDKYIKAAHKGGDRVIWPCSQSIMMLLFKKPLLDQEAVTFLITMDVDTQYITDTMGILKTSSMIKKY